MQIVVINRARLHKLLENKHQAAIEIETYMKKKLKQTAQFEK